MLQPGFKVAITVRNTCNMLGHTCCAAGLVFLQFDLRNGMLRKKYDTLKYVAQRMAVGVQAGAYLVPTSCCLLPGQGHQPAFAYV